MLGVVDRRGRYCTIGSFERLLGLPRGVAGCNPSSNRNDGYCAKEDKCACTFWGWYRHGGTYGEVNRAVEG